ncbi:MAG: sigma factor G inhibitor Gin [Desulfosporosinus sp.]|nr:sigma factor G inhibitor Gin [Desulfosporosinus sp.]
MIKTLDTFNIPTQNLAEIHEKAKTQESVSNQGNVLPVCYRCAQVPKNGLYDGFRVEGMFFCSECQQELFNAEQDSPEYQEFLFLIKGLLF